MLDEIALLRFNDVESVRRLLTHHAPRLATVVLDPMPSRGGLIALNPRFLAAVQKTARDNGILVNADEVTNLRQSFRCASARYRLVPNLLSMGKIIGGGLLIGPIEGRNDVMEVFDASVGRPLLPQRSHFFR
ncbi:aminotransferase class III-fold pyridoxal phosphate-dependent enzyme [Bradyrhizobium sp. Rc2d]|uniref:aminotransferase class III-fold pyridoxal phosphate-dependent enzyme n=1 Tax=Bradyrhizobium sp. Rc2d TaxID=1855321 RepID=UPI00159FF366|nr:aminotransferase class III-fold pyridoxal phosphate-dependent enzyme [Bradyrhizobium sp. Rc2d]